MTTNPSLHHWVTKLCDRLEVAESCEPDESRRRKSERLIAHVRQMLKDEHLYLKADAVPLASRQGPS